MKLPPLSIAVVLSLIIGRSLASCWVNDATRLIRVSVTEIFINIVAEERIITLDVKPDDKIKGIKIKISQREKIPVRQQQLIFAGQELEDEKSVSDYHIQKDATLQLLKLETDALTTP